VAEEDQVIRTELRFQDVHERGVGYPAKRLKAIKKAMQKLHTLETMAVNIYKYQITSQRNALNIQLVAAMANEMTHLQDFQAKLYEYDLRPRKTRFAFWLVGFALGTGSRLLGPRRSLRPTSGRRRRPSLTTGASYARWNGMRKRGRLSPRMALMKKAMWSAGRSS